MDADAIWAAEIAKNDQFNAALRAMIEDDYFAFLKLIEAADKVIDTLVEEYGLDRLRVAMTVGSMVTTLGLRGGGDG